MPQKAAQFILLNDDVLLVSQAAGCERQGVSGDRDDGHDKMLVVSQSCGCTLGSVGVVRNGSNDDVFVVS